MASEPDAEAAGLLLHAGAQPAIGPPGGVHDGRAPTIRDVARLAQVSLKTVSRVLNQDRFVSEAMVHRVNDAIERLGYRRNLAAVRLRRADRRTHTVGLLLVDVANPFSSVLHRAVEDEARRQGQLVFAGSSEEDPGREDEVLATFVARQVDGLVVVPSPREPAAPAAEGPWHRVPTVFVDRPGPGPEYDSVTSDNRRGSLAAIQHLAASGHWRIAFLGDRLSIWTAAERHGGYTDGLVQAGLHYRPELVRHGLATIEAAERAALDLLSTPHAPTAIFAAQNLVAVGAIKALRQLGLQRRVAMVAFDDLTLADLLDPALTVVAQDPTALGQRAASLLFQRLAGERGAAQQVVVPTRLLPRGSGEIPNLTEGAPG